MACTALEQKLKYHARKNGLTIRKIDGDNYVMTDIKSKKIVAGILNFEELKEKIFNLRYEKLKNNFAV